MIHVIRRELSHHFRLPVHYPEDTENRTAVRGAPFIEWVVLGTNGDALTTLEDDNYRCHSSSMSYGSTTVMAVALPELPRVHGQHSNRALAAARRARAIELRTTGLTYDQIATELGCANRGTVCHVVSEALKTQTAEGQIGVERHIGSNTRSSQRYSIGSMASPPAPPAPRTSSIRWGKYPYFGIHTEISLP